MITLITKEWNKTTKVHSLNNQIIIHVSPQIKKADYRSPPKQFSSPRKRTNPDKWKRNVRKLQRSSGKSYIYEGGKQFNQGITLITKEWNKTTNVHSLSNHINKQTTEVLLNNFQALGSKQIQINGNEMLENHTYMKAVKNSTREMLRRGIVQSVDLNATNMFQMKVNQVLCHFTTL